MNCFQVSARITEQITLWAVSLVTTVQQVCSNVTTQILQAQQQWQNQCTQATSQACSSLGPFSAFCSWVTSTVCNLVAVIVQVLVVVVTLVCVLVTSVVALLVATLALIAFIIVWLFCIVVPCSSPMESSTPPDPGWMVTLGGSTPTAFSQNNTVSMLPDGMLACESMIEAIGNATQRIHLLELEFDPTFIATFSGSEGQINACTPALTMMQALLAANARGVIVRILLNKNIFADSISAIATFLSAAPPNTIEVLGLHVLPEVVHAKGLIVDTAVAFMIGLPLDQGYWDTQLHLITDPCTPSRRGSGAGGNVPGLGNVGNGVGNKPAHTVSLQIAGPGAADADMTFISLWNSVSTTDQIGAPVPVAGSGSQSIQIVRTAPPISGAAGLTHGETGVLEAYLRAINNARSFIYLEEQYFTSPVIGAALTTALKANPALQLILLLNENPDMPTYKFWQNALLKQLMALPGAQIGAFTLWRTGTAPGRPILVAPGVTPGTGIEIMQCYLEAKVSVVDDAWSMVGSANLDGASTGHIFEFLPSPVLCFSAPNGWRNVELSTVLYDGIAGQPATGNVATLRTTLWEEHLGTGLNLSGPPPAGGWLSVWKTVAQQNVAGLNATQTMGEGPSMILPYAFALEAPSQLTELGIDITPLVVAPAVPT